MKRDAGLQKAIDAIGSQAELARRLRIKAQSVTKWPRVPAERVLQVEAITGVSKHDLRPDLYPRPGVKPVRAKKKRPARLLAA